MLRWEYKNNLNGIIEVNPLIPECVRKSYHFSNAGRYYQRKAEKCCKDLSYVVALL